MSTKKFALNNSYFKNRRPDDPDTLAQIVTYHKQHGELPFRYEGDNWPYDTVCERQKRRGVEHCQFLTPDAVAAEMARLVEAFADGGTQVLDACCGTQVLDACCGTGQITKELLKLGFTVSAFDIDVSMAEVHQYLYPECHAAIADFRRLEGFQVPLIVSNPPFDRAIALEFIDWLVRSLTPGGRAVLLLPVGYVDKDRPKALADNLSQLMLLDRQLVTQPFVHTKGIFEIVVVEKKY